MKRPFESTQTDYVAFAGASETTPWLRHTGWVELFRDRSLKIIGSRHLLEDPVQVQVQV
jgi:hypothetical protein